MSCESSRATGGIIPFRGPGATCDRLAWKYTATGKTSSRDGFTGLNNPSQGTLLRFAHDSEPRTARNLNPAARDRCADVGIVREQRRSVEVREIEQRREVSGGRDA